MARPSVLLPEPLSPTRAKVVPASTVEGDVEHRVEEAVGEPDSRALTGPSS